MHHRKASVMYKHHAKENKTKIPASSASLPSILPSLHLLILKA
jgi:hypothetical protein